MAINKNKVLEAAQKLVEKGQVDKAIKEYLKVVDEDPKDVRVWLKIGDLYARKGASSEATETYLKVAGFYREQGFYLKAVAVYKQVLKLDPRLVEVNLLLAEVYRQLGLMSDAMQQVEVVAAFYLREGKSKEALATIRELCELDPENVASRIKLAELYSKEQMTAEAVAEFAKAADHLRAHNRTDDFMKVAERLVWHQPDNHAMNRELAGLYLRRSDPRHALQKLQACFKADPRDVDTLALLAQAFLALDQKSKTVSVWKEMARIHQDNGQSERALEAYRKILSIQPDDADALVATGRRAAPAAQGSPTAQGSPAATGSSPARITSPGEHHMPTPPRVVGMSRGDHPTPITMKVPPGRRMPRSGDEALTPVVPVPPGLRGLETPPPPPGIDTAPQHVSRAEAMRDIELHVDEITGTGIGGPGGLHPAGLDPTELHAEEITKILTDADVYLRYGLNQKAIDHLQKVFALDARNVEAREKLKDVYVTLGRTAAACGELELLVGLTALPSPGQAEAYLAELAGFEGESTRARALAERHRLKLRSARKGPAAQAEVVPPAGPAAKAARASKNNDFDLREETPLDDDDQTRAFHELRVGETAPVAADEVMGDVGDVLGDATPDLDLDARPPQRDSEGTVEIGEAEIVGLASAEDNEVDVEVDAGDRSSPELGFDDLGLADLSASAPLPLASPTATPRRSVGATPPDDKTVEAALADFESLTEGVRDLGVDPADAALVESLGLRPSSTNVGETTGSLEDDLDEVDFFVAQELHSEARVILRELLVRYPQNPLVLAKLADIDAALRDPGQPQADSHDDQAAVFDGDHDDDARGHDRQATAATTSEARTVQGRGPTSRPSPAAKGAAQPNRPHVIARSAAALGEEDADTHYDLGLAYKEMGLHDEAIKEFLLVRDTPGRAVQCHLMIGLCQAERGEPDDAISEYKKGLYVEEITDREALALYFELGVAYQSKGDTAEALYYFEKVVKRDPRFRDVESRMAGLTGVRDLPRGEARAGSAGDDSDDTSDAVDAAFGEEPPGDATTG